jgi:hypothetical protein
MTDSKTQKHPSETDTAKLPAAASQGPASGGQISNRAAWLERARVHLRGADPVLARLIGDRPDFEPQAWMAELPPMDTDAPAVS